MNKIVTMTSFLLLASLLLACGEDNSTKSTSKIENPIDTYANSRLNALNMAKASAKKSNEAVVQQNKMIEELKK